jgi:hypothetical protein
MPWYQESLERGNERKNAENILKVKEIPRNEPPRRRGASYACGGVLDPTANKEITRLVDEAATEGFDENFKRGIEQAEGYGVLVLDVGVLIAVDWGLSFSFTCKNESHSWIAEQVKWGEPETLVVTEWNGRRHLEHRYRWINGIENRADGKKLLVNYRYFETYNREKGKIIYKKSWITDKLIIKENVRLPATRARARWKIENENNNVQKNCGYHLEHNFGHGERQTCEIYCILNLLAFLARGLMILCDGNFIKARSYFGRRDEFYNALRTFFWAFEFQSWDDFLLFVITHAGWLKVKFTVHC